MKKADTDSRSKDRVARKSTVRFDERDRGTPRSPENHYTSSRSRTTIQSKQEQNPVEEGGILKRTSFIATTYKKIKESDLKKN